MRPGKYALRHLLVLLLGSLAAAPLAHSQPLPSAFDLSGKSVDPLTASGGQIVVLIFVRTNCPVSNRYAPTIQQLSQAFAGKAKSGSSIPIKTNRRRPSSPTIMTIATICRRFAIRSIFW